MKNKVRHERKKPNDKKIIIDKSKTKKRPWGSTSFGAVSGSGTYVRTPSCRCSMCLTEWSVRSSEDVFRSEEEMECSNGSDI